ncbi:MULTISPECIES: SymE family type I addiction module toxin [unclassified Brenneria]|uniref:SymE family type I addiction module toxin n=1 Tax=unclassified Brenneria TaxID=2634434 RepID=UPI0015556336|nr:SymE family type I addiction module toxin [Brenneria sp. hezel4-2-4]MEE3653105.1 SymE family type I addiction module toxin [Brenneria sp. HEZEL_4_2_4]NPD03057.1 type I addiction module toxin, SymE family [Brenneria sp. hezel4-2-4]
MSIQAAFYPGELPELTLTGDELAQAGFSAGTLFRISLYRNGLILTRLDEDTDIAALLAELDGHDSEGADWIRDNGELYLAGDWLTRNGLLRQSLNIELMPGKMIIRAEFGVMLA